MTKPTVRHRTVDSPIGPLTLVADEQGLARILFPDQDPGGIGPTDDTPATDSTDSTDTVLDTAAGQLVEYFAGERTSFDLPLHLEGTDFQKEAWLALAEIPYGHTTSYGEQAEAIGRPRASRAVGAANSRNPLPIVLPCHRVIGADGSLTGFAGGTDIKRRLLDLERDRSRR